LAVFCELFAGLRCELMCRKSRGYPILVGFIHLPQANGQTILNTRQMLLGRGTVVKWYWVYHVLLHIRWGLASLSSLPYSKQRIHDSST
jgi:hypothetical protein